MDILPFSQRDGIEAELTNLESVRVMICFNHSSIIGQTYYQAEQRFLDVLNKDFIMEKQRIKNFLIINQALIIKPGGEKEQIPGLCFINKNSIIFIGTFDETRSTTSENINNKVKAYPWREKDAISVKMDLAGRYRLSGQIYGDPTVLPVHYIESKNQFLPMTSVSVSSSLEPKEITFDFVAINKDYISLLELC